MFDPTFFHSVIMAVQDDRLRAARPAYRIAEAQAPASRPTATPWGRPTLRPTLRRLRAGFRLLSQPS